MRDKETDQKRDAVKGIVERTEEEEQKEVDSNLFKVLRKMNEILK